MIAESFPVSGIATLDCSFASGSVVIETGDDDLVDVTVNTPSPESWRVAQNGDHVTVIQDRAIHSGGGRASVRVQIPSGSSVSIRTASADVRAAGRLGRVGVTTASGDVALDETDNVEIKTASGDVSVKRSFDDLTLKTASGDVRVDRCDGAMELITASGDMNLGKISGRLAASTASGDIRLQTYLGEDVEIATMSGDIALGLPPGIKVDLKATTLAGRVVLPESRQTGGDAARKRVTVRLKSISGDLRIDRAHTDD